MLHHLEPIYFKDSETFEDFICDYYSEIHSFPFYRYGRKGQSQSGVDLYQQQSDSNGKIKVIQCKNYVRVKLTYKIILKDVHSIINSGLKISEIIYVTSNERDATLQNKLLHHLNELKSNYEFNFSLVYYADIFRKLHLHKDLFKQYFPTMCEDTSSSDDVQKHKKDADTRLLDKISNNINLNDIAFHIEHLTTQYTCTFIDFISTVEHIIHELPQINPIKNDIEVSCFAFHDKMLNSFFEKFYGFHSEINLLHDKYFDITPNENKSSTFSIRYHHEDKSQKYQVMTNRKKIINLFYVEYHNFLGYLHTNYPSIKTV